jgi:hypothetical protein
LEKKKSVLTEIDEIRENSDEFRTQFGEFSEFKAYVSDLTKIDEFRRNLDYLGRMPEPDQVQPEPTAALTLQSICYAILVENAVSKPNHMEHTTPVDFSTCVAAHLRVAIHTSPENKMAKARR